MGRKPRDSETIRIRVSKGTTGVVKDIAQKLGYTYAEKGSISQLLDAIKLGEVLLTKVEKNNSG